MLHTRIIMLLLLALMAIPNTASAQSEKSLGAQWKKMQKNYSFFRGTWRGSIQDEVRRSIQHVELTFTDGKVAVEYWWDNGGTESASWPTDQYSWHINDDGLGIVEFKSNGLTYQKMYFDGKKWYARPFSYGNLIHVKKR